MTAPRRRIVLMLVAAPVAPVWPRSTLGWESLTETGLSEHVHAISPPAG